MRSRKFLLLVTALAGAYMAQAQLHWTPVEEMNKDLPPSVRVYRTTDSIGGKPNIAYYVSASLQATDIEFGVDTTYKRRLTPQQFYEKNQQPLVVVNGTFFSFETNQNLNTVIGNGMPRSYNIRSVRGRGKDSVYQMKVYRGAIGINGSKADVAWVNSDTVGKITLAAQHPVPPEKILPQDTTLSQKEQYRKLRKYSKKKRKQFKHWDVVTAIGGGPVLLQKGSIHISNEEEMMFTGKAINDRHPRTAMGYTSDKKLIILVIQGRFPGIAEGASLLQEAKILQDLGCVEALNLDGGGSSCLLVNGQETIKPSDKTGERPVPAVFLIIRK